MRKRASTNLQHVQFRLLDVPHVTGSVSDVGELIDFRRVNFLQRRQQSYKNTTRGGVQVHHVVSVSHVNTVEAEEGLTSILEAMKSAVMPSSCRYSLLTSSSVSMKRSK